LALAHSRPVESPLTGISPSVRANASDRKILRIEDLRHLERDSIIAALQRSNRKISGPGGAAELLGINPNTLASRMRSLGIHRRSP
jgi:transcriptional regulator with GAF, ATPase, and Fis domain